MLILRKNFFLFCTPTWKLDNPYCHCHWPSNSMKEHKDKQLYCWTGILNLTGTKNYTPAKTHFKWTKISSLEIDVFWLKNDSEKWFIILKFSELLQSCCCLVQKNLPLRAELAMQFSTYLWRGLLNFKINNKKKL